MSDLFEQVWKRIKKQTGQNFHTKKGIEFTYEIVSPDQVKTSRTEWLIPKSSFRKYYDLGAVAGPGELRDFIQGPSYVWAIMGDKRIGGV